LASRTDWQIHPDAANVLAERKRPFDPQLDLARKPNRHLAFGTGIHFCLGHQLARLEGICALKALFRRWPKLELAVDESEIKWRKRPGLRAIEHLPVAIGAGVSVDRGARVAALTE
jgi:cytochrome P450